MCLKFGFVIFWQKDFGAKAAHKMLVKLTTDRLVLAPKWRHLWMEWIQVLRTQLLDPTCRAKRSNILHDKLISSCNIKIDYLVSLSSNWLKKRERVEREKKWSNLKKVLFMNNRWRLTMTLDRSRKTLLRPNRNKLERLTPTVSSTLV
jgi:hypothetical protein